MKRTILALALATFAATSIAATVAVNDQYRNSAGEEDHHYPQLGDARQYRFNAGEADEHYPQLG